jgi:hypothetical protein
MDQSLYLELRGKLRKRAESKEQYQESMTKLVRSIEGVVNRQHGVEGATCVAGSMSPDGDFSPGVFNVAGPAMSFALKVRFDSANRKELFAPVVRFKATCHDDGLSMRCEIPARKSTFPLLRPTRQRAWQLLPACSISL